MLTQKIYIASTECTECTLVRTDNFTGVHSDIYFTLDKSEGKVVSSTWVFQMDDEYCKDILESHLHSTEQNQYSIIHKLSIILKEESFKNYEFWTLDFQPRNLFTAMLHFWPS